MRVIESQKQALTQQTTAQNTDMALKEHTRKDLELKFRNVHALIKKNWPISDITWLTQLDRAKGLYHSKTYDKMTAATCDGASNTMGCKTGLVTRLQECYPQVEEIASTQTEIESEREIQSNREGEETVRKIGTRVM